MANQDGSYAIEIEMEATYKVDLPLNFTKDLLTTLEAIAHFVKLFFMPKHSNKFLFFSTNVTLQVFFSHGFSAPAALPSPVAVSGVWGPHTPLTATGEGT